ncbi:YqbF domain-containing protein [Bacillus sp. SIMBA_154]|uniref:YqbF domain-containing protein n=1 Tax=Bacillus sp. SIMBA_154 TaxID=3080859 RepID=UPI00397DDFE2
MYSAVLIKGKTYAVMGHVFLVNQVKDIEKKVFQYLDGNEFFICKEVKEEEEPAQQAKIYTETELKGMNKTEQEAIIIDLGGDPSQLKDKSERIAFILDHQQQQEKTGE